MTTVGIIAEFNPFHNGHEYIIQEAKRITGADRCVIVMSGDFVQRGTPAICDKWLRTKMALSAGADAVFELPAAYATASAAIFAEAGVKLLYTLGIIDYIAFGSECGDLGRIMKIAEILTEEPFDYRNALNDNLKKGLSFPAARENAFSVVAGAELAGILKSSNNILAIEYCKALLTLKKDFPAGTELPCKLPKPVTVLRLGSTYNDKTINCNGLSSATAIRQRLTDFPGSAVDFKTLASNVPPEVSEILSDEYGKTLPMVAEDLDDMLYLKLSEATDDILSATSEIGSDFANTLKKYREEPVSFNKMIETVKTKNLTYSGISRSLLHLILGIDNSFTEALKNRAFLPYARLLGFRKASSELLRYVSDFENCNLITKLANADRTDRLLQCDIHASSVYRQLVYRKYGTPGQSEFEHSPIILS